MVLSRAASGAAALVTVRATSSRLPGKCLLPITADLTALQIVLRRAALTGVPVVVATSDDPSDDPVAALAGREGAAVFRGARLNKLRRWRDCAESLGLDRVLMVDGDDLAFDYAIGRRVLAAMATSDADAWRAPDDIVCGLFTAAYTRDALDRLAALAPDPAQDTDVIDVFIARAGLRLAYPELHEHERAATVRLTLDYAEDADFFRAMYAELPVDAPGPTIVRTALARGWWRINWGRQQDYLDNQAAFNRKVDTHADH
ncbi:cytidylyltransferase domain-containing protein [Roseospira visakhapatnamensis]|uniref:Spore coat polysaccharide biosynthesis protein SpsF n=1 Tax=Roseospira visakhapatnamensis TaxID=390880 RepID=A0A7W6WAZ0_9PROT|nr:hypothetical protein [Roseospira visakhapatnamensis]MBB4267469.1 spore coat polysaccharide biosynthesis protein SpsF [Roseospira visakhapatnamensis]